jgi:hypothetical protein
MDDIPDETLSLVSPTFLLIVHLLGTRNKKHLEFDAQSSALSIGEVFPHRPSVWLFAIHTCVFIP